MTISLFPRRCARGFTLAELMVAMAITVILLTLLVSVTAVALDGWRISRNKVRASRQAKATLEQMSRDFEAMVVRTGSNFEWLHTETDPDNPGPENNESPNAARILIAAGACVNQASRDGTTPLLISCQEGHLDVVRFLLSEDVAADVHQTENMQGFTPLHIASHRGYYKIVRLLLEHGAVIDSKDELDLGQQLLEFVFDLREPLQRGARGLDASRWRLRHRLLHHAPTSAIIIENQQRAIAHTLRREDRLMQAVVADVVHPRAIEPLQWRRQSNLCFARRIHLHSWHVLA